MPPGLPARVGKVREASAACSRAGPLLQAQTTLRGEGALLLHGCALLARRTPSVLAFLL